MKQWKTLVIGLGALGAAAVTFVAPESFRTRSVRPLPAAEASVAGSAPQFDRNQSAALFVGVRKFSHGDTVPVPYAVDDAVDLAYVFALDPRVSLVPPQRVVLALSGKPQKETSKRRLEELERAGATVAPASQSDILTLLQQQAAVAGKSGLLVVSLATHGFIRDGVPYILGEGSLFQFPETALSASRLFDIAATSDAARSLIFVDACRNRVTDKTRGSASDPSTAAPPMTMVRRMGRTTGQVVFYAAAAGQYAYDDDASQNGVFTKAVIDGLRCGAATTRGVVTAETLHTFVERQVRSWIRRYRPSPVNTATQFVIDGSAGNMPLACCDASCAPKVRRGTARITVAGSVVSGFSADGAHLWDRDAGGPIQGHELVDLDSDYSNETIVSVRGVGANRGRLSIFDSEGQRIAQIEEPMTLSSFATGVLFTKGRRNIVTLWADERSSDGRLSIYDASGELIASYEHRGHLQYVTIDRPTKHHTPKIIVTGVDEQGSARLLLLDPKKVASGKLLWYGSITPRAETIQRLEIGDVNGDRRRDISLSLASGNTFFLDFDGKVISRKSKRAAEPVPEFLLMQ